MQNPEEEGNIVQAKGEEEKPKRKFNSQNNPAFEPDVPSKEATRKETRDGPKQTVNPKEAKPGRKKSNDSTESYNPFEHRTVKKPNSDFGSLAHMLKTSLGSGVLAMPMAFKNAGLIFGLIGTLIIGFICTHCIQMLVRSAQVLSKRIRVPSMGYSKTAEVAFETGPPCGRKIAKTAKVIITSELLLSFILGNTVYVVFIAQSVLQVVEFYTKPGITIRMYILMLWIPLSLMCLFRTLKSLVPFSIIANFFVVISFGITLYYIFRDIHKPESVNYIASFEKIPIFLTTVIFAIEGIGTVLPIENEMKHPEHFIGGRCPIAYISMSIVVFFYSVIGFFGYLEYGEDTEGSITLNLPVQEVPAQVVKVLIASAIFFTYALQFYVPINIIWDLIKDKVPPKHHVYYNTAVRLGLVTLTIIVSVAVPNLEPIISLVGAICFSMLGLLLPALIDTMTRWPDFGRYKWRLCKNVLIMILSVVALVSGTYTSVLDIIKTYLKQK